jgi:peroxiredoxin
MVKVGDRIPDFELDAFHNEDIMKIKLSDCRGKWLVLMFYPADFTFVCPTELREMAANYEKFKEQDAEVMSVSTDTAYVHAAWHENSKAVNQVQFPMLADPTGALCRAFETYIDNEGLSLRATFIIDPEGVLKAMEIHDNSIGRSPREILRKLTASKYVSEHPGEACPVSWEPGQETLKPGVELIGKI